MNMMTKFLRQENFVLQNLANFKWGVASALIGLLFLAMFTSINAQTPSITSMSVPKPFH